MLSAPLTDGRMTMEYDSANRLIKAGDHTYTYNAEDVRIRNLCSDADTTYVYNTNCKLSQLLMKKTGGAVTKYVYGLGLIGEEKWGEFKTYHFDYRGSTVALTNEYGNIIDTFKYDTYGRMTEHNGYSFVIFGYNGRDGVVTDKNGLIYMRARYYSPEMRRFVNADIVPGEISNAITLNRYAYANGNPVSNVDPFGLSAERGSTTVHTINLCYSAPTSYTTYVNLSNVDYSSNYLMTSLKDHCFLHESGKQGPECPPATVKDIELMMLGYCVRCGVKGCCGGNAVKIGSNGIERMRNVLNKVSSREFLEEYKRRFVIEIYSIGLEIETKTGIPAAIIASQAILESGYGAATPKDIETQVDSYNLFGIKGTGTAGSVMSVTHEKDRTEKIVAEFRAYNSYEESLTDHTKLLTGSRYGHLLGGNIEEWAFGLQEAGYCQDSDYADSLLSVANYWDLS